MAPVTLGKRRNLFIGVAAVFVIILILYSQPVVDTVCLTLLFPHL